MEIKQDPITTLWCRNDGAVLMPPCHNIHRFTYTWTFGTDDGCGYRQVRFRGKNYYVHRMVCRAFNGLPPEGKVEVDHINRIRHDNRCSNLHWVNRRENCNNQDKVDQSIEKYNCRYCTDKAAYDRAYRKAHREKYRAYGAAKYAKMKAQGFHCIKGPDGKWGWYPRIRT